MIRIIRIVLGAIILLKKTLKNNLLVVKVGTNVITEGEGRLDHEVLKNLVDQLSYLRKENKVILVSSGAVGSALELVKGLDVRRVADRQVLAAIGQPRLMSIYSGLFEKKGFRVAQVLATKEDFRDRRHYLNMRSCISAVLKDGVIPIINENDVISIEELMFTDNDELAGLIAMMMEADKVLMLTSVDGFFDRDPADRDAKLISKIEFDDNSLKNSIVSTKSSFGRGGMLTKFNVAKKLAKIGISSIFLNGKVKDVLKKVCKGEHIGTKFLVSDKPISNIKRWIYFYDKESKGEIFVNKCAAEILADSKKSASLLLVGVTKILGDFEKGDIIKIKDQNGKFLGIGKSQWSCNSAKKNRGNKGVKPLIHYDYLYIY